jgi:hypothetical protein
MDSKRRGRFSGSGNHSGAEEPKLARAQDVEFSLEEADEEDLEALARAEAAERQVKREAGQGP